MAGEAGNEDAGLINIPANQVHPSLANAANPTLAQVHQITVNGQVQEVTTAQLIERAQKGSAADERFREASALQKENSEAINVHEDLTSFFEDGDVDAFRRIGAQMGLDAGRVEEVVGNMLGDEDDEDESDEDLIDNYNEEVRSLRTRPHTADSRPVDYSRLAPDVQRALREVERGRIEKIVQSALDTDEDIAYNIGRYDVEGQRAIRHYVDEKIRGRLDSYGGDFGDGTRILSEILPEVKEHLKALGIPKSGSMSLGHAPGGGDMEVYPRQKPDHVSSQEGDAYEQNILETLAFHQSRAQQGRQ